MTRENIHADPHVLLQLAERRASVVAQVLLSGQPEQLELATRELHSAAIALSEVMQRLVTGSTAQRRDFMKRLQAVASVLALQREACLRRLGSVERSLNSILPATRASTYSGAATTAYTRGGSQGRAFRAC